MIAFILALAFGVIWGVAENRLFKEQGEWWLLNHFKKYHIFLLLLTILVAGMGCENSILKFIFINLWTPLALDVTWWIIRYYEITKYGQGDYGEPNAWHMQSDWDNWLGLPLVLGIYWWWWVLGIACLILGQIMVTVA